MDKKRDTLRRAQRIETLLGNKDIQDALEDIRQDIFELWYRTASDQTAARERFYHEAHALRTLRARLIKQVKEGKRIEAELERNERPSKH